MSEAGQPKVAIVGAGIVGISAALHLQRLGATVTVIDRGEPGSGASHGNAGVLAAASVVPVTVPGLVRRAPRMLLDRDSPLFLRWQYLPRLMPWLARYLSHGRADRVQHIARHLTPLVSDSLDEHLRLTRGTAAEAVIRRGAFIFAYPDRHYRDADAFGWDLRRACGFRFEPVDGPAVRDRLPALSTSYTSLMVLEDQHSVISQPGAYVRALAEAFAAGGGTVLRAEVTGFLKDGGAVGGVTTTAGPVAAGHTLIAAGAWSQRLLATLGIKIPLESERGYHVEFVDPTVDIGPDAVMLADGKCVAATMGNRLRVAGLVEFGGLDAPASAAPPKMLQRRALRAFPGLQFADTETWLGHRPATTDSLPVWGPSATVRGLHFAFGHHHIGLTSGPKTGRLIAEAIAGGRPNFDFSPYCAERFASATPAPAAG